MLRLSVNVNKIATLRNARGGDVPSVLEAVETILAAGCRAITVHPRSDQRHIRRTDVFEIAELIRRYSEPVELNVEGDPRPDWIDLVEQVQPTQATLVPVKEGEITSNAGWSPAMDPCELATVVTRFKERGIRTSVFVDANLEAIEWAKKTGTDRVELYTEPYAREYRDGLKPPSEILEPFYRAAQRATELGLGVNAGHDLDLNNLPLFVTLTDPSCGLREVSIGHALISRAIFEGLGNVVREYLDVVGAAAIIQRDSSRSRE